MGLAACTAALPELSGVEGYAPRGLATVASFSSAPGSMNHFRMSVWNSLAAATEGVKHTGPLTGKLKEFIDDSVPAYRKVMEADFVDFGTMLPADGFQGVVMDCAEYPTKPGTGREAMAKQFAPDGKIKEFFGLKGCPQMMILTYP